jgi:hypothetical protein
MNPASWDVEIIMMEVFHCHGGKFDALDIQ